MMEKKFFVGTKLTVELRPLISIYTKAQCEGKEYLGFYLDTSTPTLDEVEQAMEKFASMLAEHRIEIPSRQPKIVVFPQLFLG